MYFYRIFTVFFTVSFTFIDYDVGIKVTFSHTLFQSQTLHRSVFSFPRTTGQTAARMRISGDCRGGQIHAACSGEMDFTYGW